MELNTQTTMSSDSNDESIDKSLEKKFANVVANNTDGEKATQPEKTAKEIEEEQVSRWSWFIFEFLTGVLGGSSAVLINFFLWQEEQSLDLILFYNFWIILASFIFNFSANYLTVFLGSKLGTIFGLMWQAFAMFLASILLEDLSNYLLYFGVFTGIVNIIFYRASTPLFMRVEPQEFVFDLFSFKQIFWTAIAAITTPIIVNYGVEILDYRLTLQILGWLYLATIAFVLLMKVKPDEQEVYLFSLFKQLPSVSYLKKIAGIRLSLGAAAVYSLGLFNILILENIGSIADWQYISISLTASAVVIAYFVKKIESESEKKTLILVSTMLFALVPLVLFVNFTLVTFLIFSFTKTIYNRVTSILAGGYAWSLQGEDPQFDSRIVSYATFSQSFTQLGQLIPLIVLIALPEDFLNTTTLTIALALIALIPFLFAGVYTKEDKYF
jgi:MFS family permease